MRTSNSAGNERYYHTNYSTHTYTNIYTDTITMKAGSAPFGPSVSSSCWKLAGKEQRKYKTKAARSQPAPAHLKSITSAIYMHLCAQQEFSPCMIGALWPDVTQCTHQQTSSSNLNCNSLGKELSVRGQLRTVMAPSFPRSAEEAHSLCIRSRIDTSTRP